MVYNKHIITKIICWQDISIYILWAKMDDWQVLVIVVMQFSFVISSSFSLSNKEFS